MYKITVPTSQVVMTQPYLEEVGLATYLRRYDARKELVPRARKIGNGFHVLDGHHRAAICDIVSGKVTLAVHESPEDYDPKEGGAYLVYTRWISAEKETFGTVSEFRRRQSPWLQTEDGVRSHLGIPKPEYKRREAA